MPIAKISDLPNAITPNCHDSGSRGSGLSGSFVKDVMRGRDASGRYGFAVPYDADDFSRCVVSLENAKENLAPHVFEERLDLLKNTSTEWEGIINHYEELRDLLVSNYPDVDCTRILMLRKNSVAQTFINKEYCAEVHKKIKTMESQYTSMITREYFNSLGNVEEKQEREEANYLSEAIISVQGASASLFKSNYYDYKQIYSGMDVHQANACIFEANRLGLRVSCNIRNGGLMSLESQRHTPPRLIDPKRLEERRTITISVLFDKPALAQQKFNAQAFSVEAHDLSIFRARGDMIKKQTPAERAMIDEEARMLGYRI